MKRATQYQARTVRAIPRQLPVMRCIAASLLLLGATVCAWGAPQDGVVRAGSATISQSGNRTNIAQTSQRAVIDWRSFSIGANERVHFSQPSAAASTLNRVTGDQASHILGRLSANGQVILINPNGIMFGQGARVDVGSLIATTSRIGDDRLAGYMERGMLELEPGRPGAGIVQRGTITAADGGLVALVAPHVRNDGLIQARLGKVTLAAGDRYTIDLAGDGLLHVALSEQHRDRLMAEDGKPVTALIDQAGSIDVAGGRAVLIAAADAKTVLDDVINLSGVVRADSARMDRQGRLILGNGSGAASQRTGAISVDGGDGTVSISGHLVASGKGREGRGGTIEVAAGTLKLADSAYFEAAGRRAAGVVRLGGLSVIGRSEAGVISRTLRTGTHVAASSAVGLEVASTIDGRGAVAGAGLTLQAQDGVIVDRDILTEGGAITLASHGGDIEVRFQATPIDGDRINPILFAKDAPISLFAARNVLAYDLITSGDVVVASSGGSVRLGAKLGYSFNGPIGSLSVTASSADPDSPGDVLLSDVRVAPGGSVSVSAFRNVQLFLPDGAAPEGLLAAGGVTLQSELLGDLWNNDLYPVLATEKFIGPGEDGDWATLGDNERDPELPGIPPPGPTNGLPPLLALEEIAPREVAAVEPLQDDALPATAEAAPPRPFVVAAAEPASETVAAAQSEATRAAVAPNGEPVGPGATGNAGAGPVATDEAVRVADARGETPGPASGGRGVAQDADLGRGSDRGASADVFESATHVVEGPVCELEIGGANGYFASDAFGRMVAAACM